MRKNTIFSVRNLDRVFFCGKFEEGVEGVREEVNVEKRVARSVDGG